MKDLTTGKEWKRILMFALPMLLGTFFQLSYNIVDSIIVGRLIGKEALAGIGASFPIIFALVSFVIGISTGGTIVVSQYFGAKDFKRVRYAIDTIFIFTFFSSIIITAVGIGFSRYFFHWINLPEEAIPEATQYLNTYMAGSVLLFGFYGISSVLRGLGDSVTPLVFVGISTLLNVVLDIVFIKYLGMGVRGAAYATVISHGVSFFAGVWYLNKYHKLVQIKLKELKFHKEIFVQTVRIGLPSGFQQTFVSLGMVALFRIVNRYGTDVAAAYSVAGRIDNLAILPSMVFGQALSTFVGQNLGANKIERVKAGLRSTFFMSSIFSLLITIVVLLFRENLIGMFTTDQNVISIGMKYLVIVSSCYLIFNTMFAINGVLRGAGATLIPMFITLLSLWIIRIPFAHLLSNRLGSEVGIWYAVPIAWLVGVCCSYLYYLTGKWKKKGVVGYTETEVVE